MRRKAGQVITVVLFMSLLLLGVSYKTVSVKEPGLYAAENNKELTKTERLRYMVVEKPYMDMPDTQRIVASFGEDNRSIKYAEITYQNRSTGEQKTIAATTIAEDGVVFEIPHTDGEEGIYQIDAIYYTVNDISETVFLEAAGMEVLYGVEKQVKTEPDAIVVEENNAESDMNIVTFDENGCQTSETSIQDAIEKAKESMVDDGVGKLKLASNGNIVVVLDPGHDSTHGGANKKTDETVANLRIALACRDELQRYSGVEVYMTRETSACPYPGTTSSNDNANRVAYAASVGADVYVSIHCNSASTESANGCEVYYPNNSYNAAIGQNGQGLASQVQSQLVALGIKDRGIKVRNSESGDTYADGSPADYYAVIRKSKQAGFPGIIIEHGFVTNDYDVNNFIGSEEGCKRLGIADATAIAKYFNLSQGSDTVYQGVDYSAVYNKEYYYQHYADLAAGFGNNSRLLLKHFVENGMREGRQGNSIFNAQYYKSVYGDLRAAFGDDMKLYCQHFMNNGMSEGRQGSAQFNVTSYIYQYADLRKGFGNNLKLYYMHYAESGEKEGRQGKGCTTMQNTAVTYNGVNYSTVYDYNYYVANNETLKNSYGYNDTAMLEHFVNHGMSEGRQGNNQFNVYSYRNQYADLRGAFGNNLKQYYIHYVTNGKSEGRKGTGCTVLQGATTIYNGVDYASVYDYTYYTKKYGDIAQAYGEDDQAVLAHFVNHGMSEGRQGNNQFNVYSYRNQYADLRGAFGNNLKQYYIHYVTNGKSEGRKGTGCTVLQGATTMYNGVDYASVYDYTYYTKKYGDIAQAYGEDDQAVLAHFVNHGMNEGRQGSVQFNVWIYKDRYPDLSNAFGQNLKNYYIHYVTNGKAEGRTGV